MSRRGIVRRLILALTGLLVLAGVSLLAAPPAQAWVWSPSVSVVGFASCKTGPYSLDAPAQATWLYLYSTGEVAEQSAGWTTYWEAHLHTVPTSGSWAAAWIYCAVPGTQPGWRFVRYLWVTRPWVGAAIGPYWLRA